MYPKNRFEKVLLKPRRPIRRRRPPAFVPSKLPSLPVPVRLKNISILQKYVERYAKYRLQQKLVRFRLQKNYINQLQFEKLITINNHLFLKHLRKNLDQARISKRRSNKKAFKKLKNLLNKNNENNKSI